MVNYTKSQTGNFFATSFDGTDAVTILAGDSTKTIDLVTHDDNVDEQDGSFTISLASSSTYTLGTTFGITVNVADNDDLPVINIADASPVVEGIDLNAVFTLTASHPASETRTINVSVFGATGFIPSRQIPTTATLAALSTTATLNIPIEDDDVDEADGIITVTISAPSNVDDYQIGTESSAQVAVSDDDEPQGPPVINLSTSTSSITEGETAIIDFTLSQAAPDNGLTVHYSISETGNYLYSYIVGSYQVVIPAGEISKEFGFKTYDDEIDEPNGSFTISLTQNDLYTLGTVSTVIGKYTR